MSNAKRPTTARKHTRATEEKRETDLDQGVRLTIEGESYEARIGDVTPAIARELRKHTGMGFMTLMNTMSVDPDVDLVSAFVWVARRIKGEFVAFDDVIVGYSALLADGFEMGETDAEKVSADSPEA